MLCTKPASILLVFSLVLAIAIASVVPSAHALDVLQIEEHWELAVGGPEEDRCAPQISMVMSPTDSLDDDFFMVTLNHWSFPDFAAGGIQVQRWRGEQCLASTHSHSHAELRHDGEVITWTQRLSLNHGILSLEILDGSSSTWGSFGGGSSMKLTVPTTLSRLNDYQPAISLGQSGIGYAGNRVSSLVLQRLSWTTSDGETHQLVAPIDIDTDIDP